MHTYIHTYISSADGRISTVLNQARNSVDVAVFSGDVKRGKLILKFEGHIDTKRDHVFKDFAMACTVW